MPDTDWHGDVSLREGHADLGDVRLHYVEAGEGPLVVLLHGFPESWLSWRLQIPALAAAGFRVVAPDMRGYNLSSRPTGLRAYAVGRLAGDVRDLIRERGAERAGVVGHDWGGIAAWAVAMRHPEVLSRLVVVNAPHPALMQKALAHPGQLLRSSYALFFQLPWLPERVLPRADWWLLRRGLLHDARPGAFTQRDIDTYVQAWSRPGALTAMLSYYRALRLRRARPARGPRPVHTPTLVIWGERDRFLRADLAEPPPSHVPGLERVVRLHSASHWVQRDEPQLVSDLLAEFLAPRPAPEASG